MNPGTFVFSEIIDTLLYWTSFHVALTGLMFVTIITFWRYWNKRGKLGKLLSDSSYGVYIIHTIIVGAIAMLLLDVGLPSLVKFVIVMISAYMVSNGLVGLYRYMLLKLKMMIKNIAFVQKHKKDYAT